MKQYYPVCLDITGRSCLVIGGGRVAERKVRGLLASGARVTTISPRLTPGLAELHTAARIDWRARTYRPGDLADAFLVIAATDDEATQRAIQQEADRENTLLNIADVPQRCSFILPSTLRRGALTISVSTGGNSPALAKQLREELEHRFGPEYAHYLELLGRLRTAILALGGPTASNKELFQKLLHPDLLDWIREGDWPKIEEHLQAVLPGTIDLSSLGGLKEQFSSPAGNA